MKQKFKLFLMILPIFALLLCACASNTPAPADGKSAYEIAVEHGFRGSEADWLASLQGADGQDGLDGKDGADGLDGADGTDGADGANGKSAYEIAVNYGFTGTREEWVQLLLAQFSQSPDSAEGTLEVEEQTGSFVSVPGKSAYEIAVDHGFVGTEEQWLESLRGSRLEISEDGFLTIDGVKTDIGRQDSTSELYEALDYMFRLEELFIKEYQSASTPSSYSYTTSTFSGWGGSIGAPQEVNTIRFRIRARDKAITQIKVFLSENDKNGEILYSEILEVNIQPKESAYVCWELPEVFQNTEGKSLYFTYNCNQFCDLWCSRKKISGDHYQAISTYSTNGNLLSSPAKMVDVSGKPCYYLYVEVGDIRKAFTLRDEFKETNNGITSSDKVNVFLPEQYKLVVGDNFQLFYRGVVQAVDPYNYHIRVTCGAGKAYPRYFEWTPTEEHIGSHSLTLQIYDNNHNLLGQDKTTLVVKQAAEPKQNINILCVGDSLTAGGYWPGELYRRMTGEGGTPAGHGFENIHFVGTKKVQNGAVGFEGYAGWTWATFLSEKSPFYDPETGSISFKKYCERNGIDGIDVVYTLLTWNGQSTASKTDYSTNTGHFENAQTFLDILHSEYPDAIVRCMGIQIPSQNGGMGYNYGANGGYSDTYGMLVTAMHYNKTLEQLCRMDKYKDFVKFVDVAGQFDTDYNMPSTQKPVNNRSSTKETIGTNGVHPSTAGYYQIADAAYRALCHDILTRFMEPEEVPTSDTEPTVPDTTEVAPTESPVTSDPLPTEAPQTDATTPVDSGE